VHQTPAPDESLRSLYARAEAFIFPSLYEGFGIPTLEAFSCGCPVLSSDTAALREVAGDAALYFEPKSVQSIQQAMVRILSESGLRNDLRKKGEQRLMLFSWKKCAAQTLAVYEKVLGGSR
jgi:glycosyltransferase involved in cell wall biosynthesis